MSHTLHEITQVIGYEKFVNAAHDAIHQFLKEHPEHQDRLQITQCHGTKYPKYLAFEIRTTNSNGFSTEDKGRFAAAVLTYQHWMSSEGQVTKFINAVTRTLAR